MKLGWSLVVSMLAFVPATVIARAAAAAETEENQEEHPPLISVRLRASLPLTDLMFMNVSKGVSLGGFWLFGASAGVEIGSLSLEAGSAYLVNVLDAQPDSFVRAGFVPTLSEERDEEGRLVVTKLYLAGGYRKFERFFSPDGHDGSELTHALTATAGIEFSHFKTARITVTYRFLVGYTLPVSQTRTGYWGDSTYFSGIADLHNAVDLSFQLGLAL